MVNKEYLTSYVVKKGAKVKILGVVGSPRHGNTEIMIREALDAAKELGEVETDLLHLGRLKINPCIGCFRCLKEGTWKKPCPAFDDDLRIVLQKFKEADGIIVGSPVYLSGVTAQLKAMIDRTESIARTVRNPELKLLLKNKVGGAIAVGGQRGGGQEGTIRTIHNFFLIKDIIIVGTCAPPSQETAPCCFIGGHGVGSELHAVENDEAGLSTARNLGRRVAEVTKWVKIALSKED